MSIELIELARANNVYLLCLPSHTTYILQPLDVGVSKSFKSNFSKACSKYLAANPGRVITNAYKLASLVAEAWPHSFIAVNIMSGFKKCGVFPINPGEVTDRQLAPSNRQAPELVIKTLIQKNPPQFPVALSSHLKRKHCIKNVMKSIMILMILVMWHG